jgi:serine protease Do
MRATRFRRLLTVSAALVPVGSLAAQSAKPVPRATNVMIARHPLNGACATLANAPTDLVSTPEGIAILRLKRELDGMATVVLQRGAPIEGADPRRMMEMQRGVDSLVQVFVRTRSADGTSPPGVTLRGDSISIVSGRPLEGRTMFEFSDGPRRNVEIYLRSIEPQVKEIASRFGARAQPNGYLGVSLSGAQIRSVSDSGSITAHCDYPVIEAVDVGSPARQAGLEAGDTVVAYNGRDVVAQAVNYPQLLVPGKQLRIKVRRDGKVREVPVTITERPQIMSEALTTAARRSAASGGVMVKAMPIPGSPLPSTMAVGGSASMVVLLGAQLDALDDDFAQSMGIEPGVLIRRVMSGSPAAEAGLRAGDVIRAVNGAPVRDLQPIQRAIAAPGAHEIKLQVSARETATRVVTVKW